MIYQDYSNFSELYNAISKAEQNIIKISAPPGIGVLNFTLDLALDLALSKEKSVYLCLVNSNKKHTFELLDNKLKSMQIDVSAENLPIKIIDNYGDFHTDENNILLLESRENKLSGLTLRLSRKAITSKSVEPEDTKLSVYNKQTELASIILQYNGTRFIEIGQVNK